MTDIVEWLRGVEPSIQGLLFGGPMCTEAANEIEALRNAAKKALRLIEYADYSDDCQYGTLDTTLVRDLLADLSKLLEVT